MSASTLYIKDGKFTEDFCINLIKTINWTNTLIANIKAGDKVNFSTVLRYTNPDYKSKPFYRYEDTWSGFAATPSIPFNYPDVLNNVLAERTDYYFPVTNFDLLGQILEFDIDLTTHDGAPCAASHGFIDESDIPPIDTWFYLTETKLYCWIPAMFIKTMQDAIDVEILDSYRWIKKHDPYLYLQAKQYISKFQ